MFAANQTPTRQAVYKFQPKQKRVKILPPPQTSSQFSSVQQNQVEKVKLSQNLPPTFAKLMLLLLVNWNIFSSPTSARSNLQFDKKNCSLLPFVSCHKFWPTPFYRRTTGRNSSHISIAAKQSFRRFWWCSVFLFFSRFFSWRNLCCPGVNSGGVFLPFPTPNMYANGAVKKFASLPPPKLLPSFKVKRIIGNGGEDRVAARFFFLRLITNREVL